jgi:hypothetical protein
VKLREVKLLFCFTVGSVFAFSQHFEVKENSQYYFSSYSIYFLQNQEVVDSICISQPFQDINNFQFYLASRDELVVYYESNGTNRLTHGITITVAWYRLNGHKIELCSDFTLSIYLNKLLNYCFILEDSHLKINNKHEDMVCSFLLSNCRDVSNLKKAIIDLGK